MTSSREPSERPPRAGRTKRIARRGISAVLIVLTCILVPVAVLTVWVHDIALDTDRYVDTVAPLASDPAIEGAAVKRITRAADVRVDGSRAASDIAAWLQAQRACHRGPRRR